MNLSFNTNHCNQKYPPELMNMCLSTLFWHKMNSHLTVYRKFILNLSLGRSEMTIISDLPMDKTLVIKYKALDIDEN